MRLGFLLRPLNDAFLYSLHINILSCSFKLAISRNLDVSREKIEAAGNDYYFYLKLLFVVESNS